MDQRVCWYSSQTVDRVSVQHLDTYSDDMDDIEDSMARIQGPNQTCPKASNYCYALWKEDSQGNSSKVVIIAQGIAIAIELQSLVCWVSQWKGSVVEYLMNFQQY